MNKTELIEVMAEKAGIKKAEAERALLAFTKTVQEELAAGNRVQIVDFGTFEVSERAARTGINPQTHEKITIAALRAPKFKAGKGLKDAVNK